MQRPTLQQQQQQQYRMLQQWTLSITSGGKHAVLDYHSALHLQEHYQMVLLLQSSSEPDSLVALVYVLGPLSRWCCWPPPVFAAVGGLPAPQQSTACFSALGCIMVMIFSLRGNALHHSCLLGQTLRQCALSLAGVAAKCGVT